MQVIFLDHNFQFCINCAAYTNVDEAEDDPDIAFLVNAKAVGYLAEACLENKIVLIQVSTDYVFDGTKLEPYTTEDIPNPINIYGASKLKGELNIKERMQRYYIIRASWLYSDHGKNFLKTIIRKVQMNEDLNVVNTQTGSPTSCYDLAKFIYYILSGNNLDFGIYHFGPMNKTTWFEFAKYIASHFSEYDPAKLKAVSAFESKAKRPANSVLNIKETEKKYDAIYTWEKSVNELIKKILSS